MLVAGFAALGLLVGNLIGLSATSLVKQFVSLLFVFVGGSLIALLHKLNASDRRVAGSLLFALSAATIVGIYAGVVVTEYRLLSPAHVPGAAVAAVPDRTVEDNKYVRGGDFPPASAIELKRSLGNLTIEDAYAQMHSLAVRYELEIDRTK